MSEIHYQKEQVQSAMTKPRGRKELRFFEKQVAWLSQKMERRYAIAILFPGVALVLTRVLIAYVSREHSPFVFALVTVFFVSLLSGPFPGVISLGIYLIGVAYFIVAPVGDFSIQDPGDRARLLVITIVGAFIIWIGSKLRKSYQENSEERTLYEVTIEAAADGLLVVGRDGRVSHFNQRFIQMWGLSEGLVSVHDKDWLIVHVSEQLKDPKQYLDRLTEIYAHTESTSYDVLRFKDGKVFERITKPYEREGQYAGRVTSFRDITRFEEAKDAMARALQMREDFLSIVAHELKTPLTALKMQIQLLHRLFSDELIAQHPRAKELTSALVGSGKQLEQFVKLVDDMLNVSHMRLGRLSLDRQNTDLSASIRDVVDRYQARWAESHCEIKVCGAPSVCGQWDPLRLEEVIVNLLTNATKYGAGKPVEINVEGVGEKARLMVRDHGIGIAKEDLEKIFVRFERATTVKSFRGFGIGLFITRQIIEAHGGRIWVESELGSGSTFIVELPLNPVQPAKKTT